MNDLFTLDPSLPNSYLNVSNILDNFGFSKGRFIFSYPKDWNPFFLQILESLSGLDRSRAQIYLEKKAKEIINLNIPYDTNKSWLSNAEIFDKQDKYKALKACSIQELLVFLDKDSENYYGACFFKENEKNYLDILSLLPFFNKEIFIVDKYFHLRKFKKIINLNTFNNKVAEKFPKELSIKKALDEHKSIQEKILFLRSFVCDCIKTHPSSTIIISFNKESLENDFTGEDQEICITHDLNKLKADLNLPDRCLGYSLINPKDFPHWRLVSGINAGLHLDAGIRFSNKTNHARWIGNPTEIKKMTAFILNYKSSIKFI